MPKSSQLNIETTQGDFFALWIHSLTGTEVLRGCQLDSCHCCALTDHISSGCSPFFSAGCILQGSDLLWVGEYGTILFILQVASMASRVTAPVFTMPLLQCFSRGLRGGDDAQLNSTLLGGMAWCFSHIVASPCWGCFQSCSCGPALTVTSPSGIFSLLPLNRPFFILRMLTTEWTSTGKSS